MSSHMIISLEFADKFRELISDQAEWSQKTFGTDTERGPVGPLKHLAKEAVEAQKAWNDMSAFEGHNAFKEELADCLILLLDAMRRGGNIKIFGLVEAAQAKMKINRERTWPKPTSDEPVEHER